MLLLVLLLFFMLFCLIPRTRPACVKGLCPAFPGPHPVALLLPALVLPSRQDHPVGLLCLTCHLLFAAPVVPPLLLFFILRYQA